MTKKNNEYLGYFVKGNKVLFKVDGVVYTKKIKEKNKVRLKKYALSESINIICNDLTKNYAIVSSDNQPYYNKPLLTLNCVGIFASLIGVIITMMKYNNLIVLSIALVILLFLLLTFQTFYIVLKQPKKLFKKYTATAEGEIIDYSRKEYRHDTDQKFHCEYNVMYKFKTPNGDIIHSVVHNAQAKTIYKDYPLNKKVWIRYNPSKCCESCLLDEYNSVFSKTKFIKRNSFVIFGIGTITNITTKCIDEEVDEYLKEHCLVDYIECEYIAFGVRYKTNSIFAVPHNRFKMGEKIRIFYEYEDPTKFFCDINKKYHTWDKY